MLQYQEKKLYGIQKELQHCKQVLDQLEKSICEKMSSITRGNIVIFLESIYKFLLFLLKLFVVDKKHFIVMYTVNCKVYGFLRTVDIFHSDKKTKNEHGSELLREFSASWHLVFQNKRVAELILYSKS